MNTDVLTGIAISIYGLTQALFQIPLGLASDRIGRKPVIVGGLLVFALGSLVAATADSIEMIILGRTLQGMGAIAAATMALAADLSREEVRARIMAFIGMSIGLSFMVAMIIGPLINAWAGLSGIFWVTMGLALGGVLLILFAVPQPLQIHAHRDAGIIGDYLGKALRNPSLLRMDAGVFILHLIMTANFLVVPALFRDQLGLATVDHWKIYLPVFVGSFVLSLPMIIIAEKRHKIKGMLLISVAMLIVAELLLALAYTEVGLLLLAFLAFLSASTSWKQYSPRWWPNMLRWMPKARRWEFSPARSLWAFLPVAPWAGWCCTAGTGGVFLFSALMAGVWLVIALTLPQPKFYSSRIVKLPEGAANWQELHQRLSAIPGVREVSIVTQEQLAYLKVDKNELDDAALRAFSGASA
ncbi:MAG: MFS transporter [Thiolinea sp.]